MVRLGRFVVLAGLVVACGEREASRDQLAAWPAASPTVSSPTAEPAPEAHVPVAAVPGSEPGSSFRVAESTRSSSEQSCRDDPEACVRRAVALTRTDLPRAAELFEVACDEGDAAGCGNFAVMLRDGRAVGADRERARRLLDHACRHGHAPSCDNRRALDH